MWSEIKKSEEHKNLTYKDVFSVEVFPMSHFIFKHDSFLNDVKTLRRKLTDRKNEEYIMKDGHLNNVPLDSLFNYMKDIWTVIE